jgi:hypothetical protein
MSVPFSSVRAACQRAAVRTIIWGLNASVRKLYPEGG